MTLLTAAIERCRIVGGDLLYALRGLKNAPGYAITLLLTLALGLGAVTAMLAIVDSVLLRPVQIDHSEQLVVISGKHAQGGTGYDLDTGQIDTLRSRVSRKIQN